MRLLVRLAFALPVYLAGAMLIGIALADESRGASPPVRVMTFNIRYDNPSDGLDRWPLRRDELASFVAEQKPDVAGFQEVVKNQLDDLAARLDGYAHIGVARNDGRESGEYSPVFYRTDRWRLVRDETIWLSDQPLVPGSRGWDAALPRVCTCAVLEEIATGRRLAVLNTHFDHRGAEARRHSGELVREKAATFAEMPVVVMGDLNAPIDSAPLKALLERGEENAFRLIDARAACASPAGPDSTWCGFTEVAPNRRIDHILVGPSIAVPVYSVFVARRGNGRFLSDHLPVVCDIEPWADE